MKSKEALIANGLSAPEVDIYLAILRNGQVSVSDIARLTKYNRTTLYPYITSLLQQNYIFQTRRGKRTQYLAHSPQKLLAKATKQQEMLAQTLPELETIFREVNQQPVVRVHTGEQAAAEIFRTVAKNAFYIKSISSPSSYLKRLPLAEARHFDRLIEANKVKPQVLCPGTEENIKALQPFAKSWLDIKLLPAHMHSPMEFLLFNQTTLITSWEQLEVTEIQSEDITGFFTSLFDHYWSTTTYFQKTAKEPPK